MGDHLRFFFEKWENTMHKLLLTLLTATLLLFFGCNSATDPDISDNNDSSSSEKKSSSEDSQPQSSEDESSSSEKESSSSEDEDKNVFENDDFKVELKATETSVTLKQIEQTDFKVQLENKTDDSLEVRITLDKQGEIPGDPEEYTDWSTQVCVGELCYNANDVDELDVKIPVTTSDNLDSTLAKYSIIPTMEAPGELTVNVGFFIKGTEEGFEQEFTVKFEGN